MRVALRVVLDSFDSQSVGVVNTEEELFQAVAQILAYVYRVAGRRRLGTA